MSIPDSIEKIIKDPFLSKFNVDNFDSTVFISNLIDDKSMQENVWDMYTQLNSKSEQLTCAFSKLITDEPKFFYNQLELPVKYGVS